MNAGVWNDDVTRKLFSLLENPSGGVQKLRDDLAGGRWEERNRDILDSSSLDVGYKLVSARLRRS
jgi:hypothetical protein